MKPKLTEAQRVWLHSLAVHGLPPNVPNIEAVEWCDAHGLSQYDVTVRSWRITDAGRAALKDAT